MIRSGAARKETAQVLRLLISLVPNLCLVKSA